MTASVLGRTAPPSTPSPPRRPFRRRWRRDNPAAFYLFVSPWLLGFLLLTVVPLLYALWMSTTDYDGISPRWNYVGLDNYREAFGDPATWSSLLRTLWFTVFAVPLQITFGLLLAVLADQKVRGRAFFRTLFYLPAVVPPVAAALTFRMLFDRDTGAVNAVLSALGGDAQVWLSDPRAFFVLVMFILWGVGANMVISLAALQEVPRELTEAARVDGAGPWRSLWHVTLPMLSPVLFFQVVTGVIFTVQTFIPALLLSAGGPAALNTVPNSIQLFMVHAYQQAFGLGRLGYASALLWLMFLFLIVLTALVFRFGNRWVHYTVGPDGKGTAR